MAIETKMLVVALSKIVAKAETPEEIYETLTEMANVDGIKLKPYKEAAAKRVKDAAKPENKE